MRPVETIPGMAGREIKKNNEEVNSIIWYTIGTFVNVTLYTQYNNNKKKIKRN
jgi:hypothetical protein